MLSALFWNNAASVRADAPTPAPTLSADAMSDPRAWTRRPAEGTTLAERGAFVYWMHCMVCHGDQGQGLAKFRAAYPPADQNCSTRKCHAGPLSPAGFSFPDAPAIIGAGTLAQFRTAADLHDFIHSRMPYQTPGNLSDDEYWSLTAFLLQKHGVNVEQLDASSAPFVRVQAPSALLFTDNAYYLGAAGAVAIALAVGGFVIWKRRARTS